MESYIAVLNYAIPFFLTLIAIEWVASYFMGLKVNRHMDVISSLSSGMTNTIRDVLGLTVVIVSYTWMVDHFAMFTIESEIWLFVLAFIGKDFAGYWRHRFEHKINLFWNRHIVHHSSEEFNLSCALRQNISAVFGVFFFLYIPMAVIGIPAKVIAVIAPLHLFAQFWYHTRLIGRMGFLEYLIVTPSHHRVHHAINPEYMDKNFSEVFIVWDKWFGTFQEELNEVPPVYGVKRPAQTWNPILINLQHFWLLVKDAWRAERWWDKIRIWFMPTGWRPADVAEKFPVFFVDDPYTQQKYETEASALLKIWSWIQLFVHFFLMLYLFNQLGDFKFIDILLGGGFLGISIFSFTTLMDRNPLAVFTELLKLIVGFSLVYRLNGWFNIDNYLAGKGTTLICAYFIVALLATIYFTYFEASDVRKELMKHS